MTTLHPCIALALAVLCSLISGIPPGAKRFRLPGIWATAAFISFLAASALCAIRLGHLDDQKAVILSMIAGGLVAFLVVVVRDIPVGAGIALATAGACVPHLVRSDSFPGISLVFAFAVSMGVVFFGPFPGSIAAGLTGGLLTMTDYLGKETDDNTKWALIGVAMGIALSVAAIIGIAVKRSAGKALGKMEPVLMTALAAAAGFVVSKWAIGGELWLILGIAAVSGLVSHWLVPPEEEVSPLRAGIASVIWLALGTIAFSMLRGFGMATGLLEGSVVLLLLGNHRALFTVGPTLGLVIYRVLRDASPDSSRALDLGQHYGITGLAVGALIPALYSDWYERRTVLSDSRNSLANLLWAFVLVCLPVMSIVVLGAKGASGIVVGLGFSGFLIASRRASSSPAMAVVIAAGAANAAAVDWIGEVMDLTRQEKLHAFGWWAVAMAVAAVGIILLSPRIVGKEAV